MAECSFGRMGHFNGPKCWDYLINNLIVELIKDHELMMLRTQCLQVWSWVKKYK